jgi:hypothetical protein
MVDFNQWIGHWRWTYYLLIFHLGKTWVYGIFLPVCVRIVEILSSSLSPEITNFSYHLPLCLFLVTFDSTTANDSPSGMRHHHRLPW